MTPGELKFSFMTFVFAITLGLVISTFEVEPVNGHHAVLKFGYTIPALLLMVDMWIHYNKYHDGGRRNYGSSELFSTQSFLRSCTCRWPH